MRPPRAIRTQTPMLTIAHLCIDFMLLSLVGFVLPKRPINTSAICYMINRFFDEQTPSLALRGLVSFGVAPKAISVSTIVRRAPEMVGIAT
jgi:hypothetical protein